MPHPVVFDVEYPESHSRLLIFVKILLAIPHFIVVYLLTIPLGILTILAWFAILFTGRYPKAFFDFNVGVMRWMANVGSYAALLRDEYPPFSWEPGDYPLVLDIPRAERQSRFRLFIRAFSYIPNYIVFSFVMTGWMFTTLISWFAILFTGHYPKGLFKFSTGVGRWYFRQQSYLYLLRDEYPPYSVNAEARPGNEVVSAIIGAPLLVLYIGVQVAATALFATGETTRATLSTIGASHPSATGSGVRITLLDYDGDTFVHEFEVEAEKDGWFPTFYSPYLLALEPCVQRFDGASYSPEEVDGTAFDFFWSGGRERSTVLFITDGEPICALTYITTRFEFR